MNGGGESDLLVGKVKDGVIGADKDVTEDVKGSSGGGDIESHESTDALGDSVVGLLEDVILGREAKVDTVDDNVDGGSGLEDVAGGKDSLSVEDVGTKGAVEGINVLCGSGDERGSGVGDSLAESLVRTPSEGCGAVLEVSDLFVDHHPFIHSAAATRLSAPRPQQQNKREREKERKRDARGTPSRSQRKGGRSGWGL